jgi:hypothetical protein
LAPWASRNAKLRTSRKLPFAGGLVPLLLCRPLRADQMPGFLTAWLSATPSDRLAAAFFGSTPSKRERERLQLTIAGSAS